MDIKQQVQRQFGQNAQHYVNSAIHAKGADLACMVEVSQASGDMLLLDVATGGGHVANAFAPLVRKVTAYDLTENMLAAAAAFIRGNGHTNVEFVQGDAERMPFADASFDLVTCRIAPHHFPEVAQFAAEAARVVKPGGRFLLIDNVAPEADALDAFYNAVEKKRDPSHVRAWKKSEWISLLERTGFNIEMMVSFPKTFVFDDWCARVGLDDNAKRDLETDLLQAPADIRRHFTVVTGSEGKLVSFAGEAVLIKARRRT
jgi:ubiquinone/menaquinone biosynthesis C-methylase UbiE